jgi:hypothetical protein
VFDVWTAYGGSIANEKNYLAVDLAQPSEDKNQILYITNLAEARWYNHPRRGGLSAITNMPGVAIYGGGGILRGWLETDKDSALSIPANPKLNGLRPNIYDDGIDYEYQKLFIAIPDTFIKAKYDAAKNFRFRVKVFCQNDKRCSNCIPDDDDDFFIDNVKILLPSEVTDVEISTVKVIWPYTVAPASQAIAVPIRVKCSNNTSIEAPSFWVQTRIYKQSDFDAYYWNVSSFNTCDSVRQWMASKDAKLSIYCRETAVPALDPGSEVEIPMPNWKARDNPPGQYVLVSNVVIPGGDLEPMNDTTYTIFTLNYGPDYAYEKNPKSPANDVPSFAQQVGRGLTMYGFNDGGQGTEYGPSGGYDELNEGCGYEGGNGSGSIAARFTLFQADTIFGYECFFASKNEAFDDIAFALYSDNGSQPGQVISGSTMYRQRGLGDDGLTDNFWDKYQSYHLTKPVVLPTGTYWMACSQLAETGFELGASASRMGMRTTNIYWPPPSGGPTGASANSLMIDKAFRKFNNLKSSINDNVFAYENTRGSGQWIPFMPTIGNPAYAHLHSYGISPTDQTTGTLSRGSWIPLIRPYLGERSYGTQSPVQACATNVPCDTCLPVELTSFNGQVRSQGIDLFWETASEINNHGFFVDRRLAEQNDWQTITFVKGVGNSHANNSYSFLDNQNLTLNKTYQYRLRQVDLDGTQSCDMKKVVTLTYDVVGSLTLSPNYPNPFSSITTIQYNLPSVSTVNVDVFDVFGNHVKTLVNGVSQNGFQQATWDGYNENGTIAPSGTYIYKVSAGNEVKTAKMTLVR